jgi:sugar phosphate isomerase/epimerase
MTNGATRRAALVTGLALLRLAGASTKRSLKVAIFSKHLQFLQGGELAHAAAKMGFNGVDITVRAGGHVDPARVAQDLPPLVSLIRQNGLDVPMVTTDIVDAATPHTRNVVKVLNTLGIRYYRWGGFKYEADHPFSRQLESFRRRSAQLAALNKEYKVCAIYHTHSGVGLVGAPVWDIFQILNGLDSEAVAINYDIGHATIEGGLGGWIDSLHLAEPYIRGVAFKDFVWQKEARKGWKPSWVPLGQGMVRFSTFCSMLAHTSFEGPVQLHFEYPLGGAEAGKRQITIPRKQVFSAMRRDLLQLRTYLDASGLSHA